MSYHVTDPGYDQSEHCPRCGAFAARIDGDQWRCQRNDCGHEFAVDVQDDVDDQQQASTQPLVQSVDRDRHDGPPTCSNCGTVVSRDYVRVFGNDDGVLEHCYDCASRTERYSNDPVIDRS